VFIHRAVGAVSNARAYYHNELVCTSLIYSNFQRRFERPKNAGRTGSGESVKSWKVEPSFSPSNSLEALQSCSQLSGSSLVVPCHSASGLITVSPRMGLGTMTRMSPLSMPKEPRGPRKRPWSMDESRTRVRGRTRRLLCLVRSK